MVQNLINTIPSQFDVSSTPAYRYVEVFGSEFMGVPFGRVGQFDAHKYRI